MEVVRNDGEADEMGFGLAFRDRNAGRNNNRAKPTEETEQPARRGGRGPRGDRQSRTGQT